METATAGGDEEEAADTWVNRVHTTVSRLYHTNSRITGVRTELPRCVRVEHVPHEEFSGSATLRFDTERRDHVLTKVEAVPGIREENDAGMFSWTDPVTGEQRGGLVALPPAAWAHWDSRRRVWARRSTSSRRTSSSQCWPAMTANGPPPDGRISCRVFAWDWVAPQGPDGGPSYAGVRRGEIERHSFSGSFLYGGVATWTIKLEGGGEEGGGEPERVTLSSPELRAALDLRHVLDCRGPPAPVEGWLVIQSRSTGEHYYAREGVGSQWHRPGLSPDSATDRALCKSSCAIWGHRSKANVADHRDRMNRIRRNLEFKDEKMRRWRAEGEPRGLSYYDWCVESIRESAQYDEYRRLVGDDARCLEGLLELRRDYDHVASDSDLSSDDEEEEDDESEWEDYDPDELGGGNTSSMAADSRKRRRLQADPLVQEAIMCYVDSPGVASRILHGDGSNRTRSGRRFGGHNARKQASNAAEDVNKSSSSSSAAAAAVDGEGAAATAATETTAGGGDGESSDSPNTVATGLDGTVAAVAESNEGGVSVLYGQLHSEVQQG